MGSGGSRRYNDRSIVRSRNATVEAVICFSILSSNLRGSIWVGSFLLCILQDKLSENTTLGFGDFLSSTLLGQENQHGP